MRLLSNGFGLWSRSVLAASVALWLCFTAVAQDFTPLLNGKDFTGWVFVNTTPRTWQFSPDGMLVCSGKPVGEIRTERMFQNFELEMEWRHMVPGGNAGVFVWADDITARGVPFHRGIEVQVLENAYGNTASHTTHGDIFPIHGAVMKPVNGRSGGDRAFPSENRSKPSPEWNHYRIVCNDGSISLAVNGKVVTQGTDASPRKGYICLESEGGVVHYRNMRIKELPDTPVRPEDVAVENRNFRSLLTGLDLSGWKSADSANAHWSVKDWILAFDGKVPATQSRLTTSESYDARGFVLDFRFVEKSESLAIWLPMTAASDAEKSEASATAIDTPSGGHLMMAASGDERLAKSLSPTGSWNRIEAVVADGQWSWTLNGVSMTLDMAAGRGPIALEASGPIELANMYVREK